MVVRDRRRKGEVAPAEFYCSLEEGIPVPGRSALEVFGFPQRGKFPGKQTVWFLLRPYSKNEEHLRKSFFCSGGILFRQKSFSLRKSRAKVYPDRRHFDKI
jgi:hypothetical protein